MTLNVSLTPQLEEFVREKVDSGRYNSASEVVRDAGFLGDDERFGHCRWGKLAGLKNSGTSDSPVSSRRGG